MVETIRSSRWHRRTPRPVLITAPRLKKASSGPSRTRLARWGTQPRAEVGSGTQSLATGNAAPSPWEDGLLGKPALPSGQASLILRQWRLVLRGRFPLQSNAQTTALIPSALWLPLQPRGWHLTLDHGPRWTGLTSEWPRIGEGGCGISRLGSQIPCLHQVISSYISDPWEFVPKLINFLSAEKMFKNGTLLGSYLGGSAAWQLITIEYPPSAPQPEGRYVLLQQDKNQVLEVVEISASFQGAMLNSCNQEMSDNIL